MYFMEVICSSDWPELLMLVGLPGSGKSTYIKKYFNQNLRVHSSDDIREELSGDVNNQNIHGLVFDTLHKRVREDLKNGISCVYDATNISWKKRKAFLDSLKGIKCWKVCHIIATPYEVCLQQNQERDRKVPEEVIDRMYMNFDIPFYNEGWDGIEVIYTNPNYKNAYRTWHQFIEDTKNFSQDSPYHSLSLGNHCEACYNYVKENVGELPPTIQGEIMTASALHDCGKPFTQTYVDKKGNESEVAHYYSHECVGSYNSLFYTIDGDIDRLIVAALIRWHMILHFFKNWEQKTIDKYEKEFTTNHYLQELNFYDALKVLHTGDRNAH